METKKVIETAYPTYHCLKRCKERLGIKNQNEALRMIAKAYERGTELCDYSSKYEREYLSRKTDGNKKAVVYSGYCFLFDCDSGACMTVFKLSERFGKRVSRDSFNDFDYSDWETELRFA